MCSLNLSSKEETPRFMDLQEVLRLWLNETKHAAAVLVQCHAKLSMLLLDLNGVSTQRVCVCVRVSHQIYK